MQVLELYSGIGGMHMALQASGIDFEVKSSIEINPVANSIYKQNFPTTTHLNRNIQGLSAKFINNLGVDAILMSPPCQPFTRNGLQNDIGDSRTDSFKHLLDLLPHCYNIKRVLIENVKGFENSLMRDFLVKVLKQCGFIYQEFILSPTQFGVPNSRHRYYCIAKKTPLKFAFETGDLMYEYPLKTQISATFPIGDILQSDSEITLSDFYLSDKILFKYAKILDICYKSSRNSCCFTKAYARYIEGTGSVFTDQSEDAVRSVFEKIDQSESSLDLLRGLNLRYFTPREVCRLMSFPETFEFPPEITNRQKYNVLGNSINVKVVAELIKLL